MEHMGNMHSRKGGLLLNYETIYLEMFGKAPLLVTMKKHQLLGQAIWVKSSLNSPVLRRNKTEHEFWMKMDEWKWFLGWLFILTPFKLEWKCKHGSKRKCVFRSRGSFNRGFWINFESSSILEGPSNLWKPSIWHPFSLKLRPRVSKLCILNPSLYCNIWMFQWCTKQNYTPQN